MKIGYIDYALDGWHANHFTPMFQELSGGRMEVAYAYGMIPNSKTGTTSKEWCEKYGVTYCETIEEVVEKSDVIFILAPNQPEHHEEMAALALASGKPTYVDKQMAHTLESAKRMLALADANHTPCYSDSPLRHATEYLELNDQKISSAAFWGPNKISNYGIHQLDPLMMLMKESVEKVMVHTNDGWQNVVLKFKDGRTASYTCTGCEDTPYYTMFRIGNSSKVISVESPFFKHYISTIIEFFETGIVPVEHEMCLEVTAIVEAAMKAYETPDQWVAVESV